LMQGYLIAENLTPPPQTNQQNLILTDEFV